MIPRGAAPPCSLAARAADRSPRRAPHSFRHFHISQQLIAGVDVFLLAKNTGTSSDMIERFYGPRGEITSTEVVEIPTPVGRWG